MNLSDSRETCRHRPLKSVERRRQNALTFDHDQAVRYAAADPVIAAAIAKQAVKATRSNLQVEGPWADRNA